jgi:D-alanyl-D-alanine carboxypeptidase/D-alanyl-D-alanine-endopeptidase (penicillin-binding protein 4)
MADRDRLHVLGRRSTNVLAGLVVLCLVLAAAAYAFDLGERLGVAAPDPERDPAAVVPPPGLDLPEPAPAAAVAPPLEGGRLSPAAVRRALGRLTADRRLGARVAVAVSGVDGVPVHAEGPRVVTPASTMKVVTSLAALAALGPQHRFTTSTVLTGRTVTLVGGGDPFLERDAEPGYPETADLATLARRTAAALEDAGRGRVRLAYDATLFAGPDVSPDWEDDYIPDSVVSRITPLWVDGGREQPGLAFRSADPARAAAQDFAERLRRNGVRVAGRPTPAEAAEAARPLAEVHSAELVEVVQRVLEVSDNEGAEALARHVALVGGEPASFDGASAAVRAELEELGVPVRGAALLDGSGLARGNRLGVDTLLAAMATALDRDHADVEGVVSGLPVAGFSGSLAFRFTARATEGLGRVRAKTGTLVSGGVHGLAGAVTGRDGSVMLFVAVADRVRVPQTTFVRNRLDRVAAALAGCACGR